MSEMQKATALVSKDVTEIIPLGSDQAIKLSVDIVTNLIAVPTASGQKPSKNDCLKFIALCRAKHLDPFTGDCFMLGYDCRNKQGQIVGAAFSQITAHQVFLKRAEIHPQFDGMESGVVVEVEGEEIRREGDRLRKNEVLLGGWARVFRKDRSKPIYRELDFRVFDTGKSRWSKDGAGMIVKCSEADALRSAFPTHLGGLYTANEGLIRADIELRPEPLVITAEASEAAPEDNSNPDLQPQQPPAPGSLPTPQADLEKLITEAGFSFDDFRKGVKTSGIIQDVDSVASFAEVKPGDATRLLRAKTGLLDQIKKAKGA